MRAFDGVNISADTGVQVISAADPALVALGTNETITWMNAKMKVNTPDVAGAFLCTISWFDGEMTQNVSFQLGPGLTTGDYAQPPPQQVWHDRNQDLTIRVQDLVPGGSVDVILLYESQA